MKLKAVFNNETHLISRVPSTLSAFRTLLPTIFLSELPSEWSLIYNNSEGAKTLISDQISFVDFQEAHKTKTAKLFIIPKINTTENIPISADSRKTSENIADREESVLNESVALSTLLAPSEKAEKITFEREDEPSNMALSSFRSLNSEQALLEMIAKAVEQQLAKMNMNAPSNDKSILEKIEELKRLVHQDVRCDGCGKLPIEGVRYKCAVCDSFDFCQTCEATKEHQHAMIKIKWSGQEYMKPEKSDPKSILKSPKRFKAPTFNKPCFKLPPIPKEFNDSDLDKQLHMALLQEIKDVAPTFGAKNRLRVSETVSIQKPSEQNKLWGGQEKVNVEGLRLSEPMENATKKQGQAREEVGMSLFDDFLKWRQQRREDIAVTKDFMKEIVSKPLVKKNYQSDSELDSSFALNNLLAEIRSKGALRKGRRYEEESSEMDSLSEKPRETANLNDFLAEVRAKGNLRRGNQYKEEISDLKSLEMNVLNQLCRMGSPKKSQSPQKKLQMRESGSDTDVSNLLAEIRAAGRQKEQEAKKKALLDEIRSIAAKKEQLAMMKGLSAEIRAKGKQRKSCEYREDESDSKSLHTIELNQMNHEEANRRAYEEHMARKNESLDSSMHDLMEEIRAAKGEVRKEKKEKKYSQAVREKAALIKEVFPNLSMQDILEFVSNAPEDLDAEELLANYEL